MNKTIEARSPAGVLWQVEDIDGGGIIDSSHITLQIADDMGISGSTGCNRYFGAAVIEGSAFKADAIGTTRMACASALMQQEQRFVQALQAARKFEFSGDFLLLYDDSQVLRLRLIATDESGSAKAPQATEFSCEEGRVFAATFQGQEKLTLTFAGERRILQAQRAASGAKYVGGSVAFWNKGNEAMVEWDGQAFNCVQKVST